MTTYRSVLLTAAVVVTLLTQTGAQCSAGLHAGITADVMPARDDVMRVSLRFVLLNDSDSSIDVAAGSWKIVINGKEVEESDFIFGNGPRPTGGYTSLQSGQSYELSVALSVPRYFPRPGEYRVSWRGKNFKSPTVTVKVSGNYPP